MQRKQHVEKRQPWGVLKACLHKAGVHVMRVGCTLCVCVACLWTFAAQQSILQMHMQTIRVMYGGCVYVAAQDKGRLLSSLMASHLVLKMINGAKTVDSLNDCT